jgi:hypothetical protein
VRFLSFGEAGVRFLFWTKILFVQAKTTAMVIIVVPACRQRQVTHLYGIPLFNINYALDKNE